MAYSVQSPVSHRRLSNRTHDLAKLGLSGAHGRSLVAADFALPKDAESFSEVKRYAEAIRLIAERAPLRILPGERIVGSATFREASNGFGMVPGLNISGVNHVTLGFDRVLKIGYRGVREEIVDRLNRGGLDARGVELLEAMRKCLDAAGVWHKRHISLLDRLIEGSTGEDRETYRGVREALNRVPENPPSSFREALQSLWFMFAFQRLCGTWSGIGRIDQMLGDYLKRDLAAGRVTLDDARELLAHFWIKGTEWIGSNSFWGSGDGQFYQNIVLGGIDADANDVTNEVTYLVLDVVEELHISDFPIAVRIGDKSPDLLLRRVAEVQRHGGGTVAIYGENTVIQGLLRVGYDLPEARRFANDGCWEAQVPGKTLFAYYPFDLLGVLQRVLGLEHADDPIREYPDFDSLYKAFRGELARFIAEFHNLADGFAKKGVACPLASLFIEDCVERGRGYFEGGARYNVASPHAGGLANAANSLLVIRKLVYEERRLALSDMVRILRADWEGEENLRRLVLNRFEFFGNDNDEADAMVERVFNDYTDLVAAVPVRNGVIRPAGVSTFAREIFWTVYPSTGYATRKATADGHRQGEYLATNCSPSPGTDRLGPTAVINSHCKLDFTRTPNGATLELKMHPGSVEGEEGLEALVGLMRSFVRQGGWFLQIDVVDSALLREAQEHPENYPNLAVRISGWSARFATLNKQFQDMIIGRTAQL